MFFFFSSRRRHTRFSRDWSSDVCSSDLVHDVSVGGIGVALVEMAVRSDVGFSVARIADHRALFAEGPSRVLLSVPADNLTPVLKIGRASCRERVDCREDAVTMNRGGPSE